MGHRWQGGEKHPYNKLSGFLTLVWEIKWGFLQAAELQSDSTRLHSPFINETQLISSWLLSSQGEVTQDPSTNLENALFCISQIPLKSYPN